MGFIESCKSGNKATQLATKLGFSVTPYGLISEGVSKETELLFSEMEDSAIDICSRRVIQISDKEVVVGNEIYTIVRYIDIDNVILVSTKNKPYRVSFRYSHLDYDLFDYRAKMYGEIIKHDGSLYFFAGYKNLKDVYIKRVKTYNPNKSEWISEYDIKLSLDEYLEHDVVAHFYFNEFQYNEPYTLTSDFMVSVNKAFEGESLWFGDTELRIIWVELDTVVLRVSSLNNIIVMSLWELMHLKTYRDGRYKCLLNTKFIINGYEYKAVDFSSGRLIFSNRDSYPIRMLYLVGIGFKKEVYIPRWMGYQNN